MNIKILFIFLVLLLVAGNFTRENLSKDFMSEASGGMLVKKDNKMENSFNKDPNNKAFDSDLNSFIQKKAGSDRAVIVDKDTTGLQVNKPAEVTTTIGGEEQNDDGSGCNDLFIFGLILLLVIYTVYFQIENKN
jgi:hypothetical protein